MNKRHAAALAALILTAAALTTAPAVADDAPVTCMGRTVTIMGTDGPDNLIGQSGVADVIYAGGGNDFVSGGDFYEDDEVPGRAADYICGGPGEDHINGGDGQDSLRGQRGDDVVRGNAGADFLLDDSCSECDSGNDVMTGGPGKDEIVGGW